MVDLTPHAMYVKTMNMPATKLDHQRKIERRHGMARPLSTSHRDEKPKKAVLEAMVEISRMRSGETSSMVDYVVE